MYRVLFLVIIATLGISTNYISHPRLSNYPQVISKIDSLSKKVNTSIKNINYGGCGYFAYYLTDLLDSTGLPYEICILNFEKDTNHITHVLVYLSDYNLFVDSRGVYKGINVNGDKFFYCLKINRTYSKAQLRHAISTFKWNKRFNVKDTIQLENSLRL